MHLALAVLGTALVLLAVLDALWTTLWVDGSAGPVTGRVTTWIWRAALSGLRGRHRPLTVVGPLVLVNTVALWIVLLWAGWVLLLASDPEALARAGEPGTADGTGRIWYVAYTMFTVGNGDYRPQEGTWQLVSALIGISGMSVVTLAVTYLLSVLSAVVGKRAFADQVHGLGATSEQLVLSGWDGRDLRSLDRQLSALASQLSQLTEQYLSYPVLQYYHAASMQKSPVKAVAVLDDALLMLRHAVHPEQQPEAAAITTARSAIRSFIENTLEAASIDAAPQPPPAPSLRPLRAEGVRTVDDDVFVREVDRDSDRRRTLLGLVRGDGWEWED
jgi:hypothetical protein